MQGGAVGRGCGAYLHHRVIPTLRQGDHPFESQYHSVMGYTLPQWEEVRIVLQRERQPVNGTKTQTRVCYIQNPLSEPLHCV